MPKLTLKEIAAQAGVSIATVSRVLNKRGDKNRIRRETQENVMRVAKELGFDFYGIKKSKRERPVRKLGLVIPDISHLHLGELARAITRQAQEHGCLVLICDTMEDTAKELEAIELLLNQGVDGLFILPVGIEMEHINELWKSGTALVALDRVMPGLHCPTISVSNYEGSYEAVNYLISRGHKRIACTQLLRETWISNQRIRAFRDAHRARGLKANEALIVGDTFGQRNGYLEVKLLLNSVELPTAIFALSHITALGALRAIRDEGLKVPDDISVLGFDDIPFSEHFSDAITCVRQPINEMALVAVNLLIEQIEFGRKKKQIDVRLPTTLVRRNSVKNLVSTEEIAIGG